VCTGWQYDRHAIVDVGEVRVWCSCDDRATFYFFAACIDPAIPQSSEGEEFSISNLEAVWLVDLSIPRVE
jgi:hypothetical protein